MTSSYCTAMSAAPLIWAYFFTMAPASVTKGLIDIYKRKIHGSLKKRSILSALAMVILRSCTKPSECLWTDENYEIFTENANQKPNTPTLRKDLQRQLFRCKFPLKCVGDTRHRKRQYSTCVEWAVCVFISASVNAYKSKTSNFAICSKLTI